MSYGQRGDSRYEKVDISFYKPTNAVVPPHDKARHAGKTATDLVAQIIKEA